jgi:predicted dehydrogenase
MLKEPYPIERRRFLQRIGALTGSTVALSAMPWLSVWGVPPAGRGAAEQVRLGIIGVGSRGRQLLLLIQEFMAELNVAIVAVCDDYAPHYLRALELTGGTARGCTDYRAMLDMEDLDGVVIATPLHAHAQMTVAALQAGKHVFCEKALARTLDGLRQMYDAQKAANRVLMAGHQRMCNPVYLAAIDRIRRGELGPITQIRAFWHRNNNWRRELPAGRPDLERKINWRMYEEYSAGLLTELGSHHFQVANWVMGGPPVSVVARGSINYWRDGREVPDNVACIFTYPNGTHFIYDSLISNKKYGLEIQVMGDQGTLELETNRFYTETPPAAPAIRQLIHNVEKRLFEAIPIGGASWVPETPVPYHGDWIAAEGEVSDTQLLLEAFVRFIRAGAAPEMMLAEGYNSSLWCLLAEQAIRTGTEIRAPERYRI